MVKIAVVEQLRRLLARCLTQHSLGAATDTRPPGLPSRGAAQVGGAAPPPPGCLAATRHAEGHAGADPRDLRDLRPQIA